MSRCRQSALEGPQSRGLGNWRCPLNRYSLGTKNTNLKYNVDGSLTIYAGAKSPGADKESNWLPAPDGAFSLYIRAYWADKAIIDGSWTPPVVQRVN